MGKRATTRRHSVPAGLVKVWREAFAVYAELEKKSPDGRDPEVMKAWSFADALLDHLLEDYVIVPPEMVGPETRVVADLLIEIMTSPRCAGAVGITAMKIWDAVAAHCDDVRNPRLGPLSRVFRLVTERAAENEDLAETLAAFWYEHLLDHPAYFPILLHDEVTAKQAITIAFHLGYMDVECRPEVYQRLYSALRGKEQAKFARQAVKHKLIEDPGELIASGNPQYARYLTETARYVLSGAEREALSLWHDYVGTEHLLLSLTWSGNNGATEILKKRGADTDRISREVRFVVPLGRRRPRRRKLPRQPGISQVVETARAEARRMKLDYVGPGHLLVGLLETDDGLGKTVLSTLCITAKSVRAALRRRLRAGGVV